MQIRKRNFSFILSTITIVMAYLFLTACASSDLSRDAATNVDDVVANASDIGKGSDPVGAFQTAKQVTKGGLLGAGAGAIIGSTVSGVGTVPGALGGAVFGAALGAYIDQHTTWRDKLENAGGQVIILGDQVKIILPSPFLFHSMTPTLNTAAYSTLDLVAQYIRSLDKIAVKIAAYTNAVGPARINQEISQEQAKSVARYLWTSGVNARLMTAAGYGGTNLVRQNSIEWNEGDNYRVEITVERV